MAINLNGWKFNRGLDDDFVGQLRTLAKESGWFAEVLADEGLILGIRNNYLNVYWHGQSLFEIKRPGKSGPLKIATHPKYLLNPDVSNLVPFDGSGFAVGTDDALIRAYKVKETLALMKRAAKV